MIDDVKAPPPSKELAPEDVSPPLAANTEMPDPVPEHAPQAVNQDTPALNKSPKPAKGQNIIPIILAVVILILLASVAIITGKQN